MQGSQVSCPQKGDIQKKNQSKRNKSTILSEWVEWGKKFDWEIQTGRQFSL